MRVVPGAARMWDLTVATVHTFAVGDAQAVVHNADFCRLPFSKFEDLTGALDKDKPVTVIGRDMEGRVNPFKARLEKAGFKVNTWHPKVEATLHNNREWLRYWVEDEDSQIVNIGGNTGRKPSIFFDMEERMTAKWGANVFRYNGDI